MFIDLIATIKRENKKKQAQKAHEAYPNLEVFNSTTAKPQKKSELPLNIAVLSRSDDTLYRMTIHNEDQEISSDVIYEQRIYAGEPNHVTFSSTKVLCLDGYFREGIMQETMFISTSF